MKILKATVILSRVADQVLIETDLPSPFGNKYPLSLRFETTYDKGAEYVRNNFGIEPEVIDTRVYSPYGGIYIMI
jgi:hypothetical protein